MRSGLGGGCVHWGNGSARGGAGLFLEGDRDMVEDKHRSALSGGGFGVEGLEARRLLAASVAGVLNVRGTEGADDIVIALNGSDDSVIDVTINGAVTSFAARDVEGINVRGLGGNDDIDIDASLDEL